MNASTALVYGPDTSEGPDSMAVTEVDPSMPGPSVDGDSDRRDPSEESDPFVEESRGDCRPDGEGEAGARGGNGAVWWPDFESPDKPLEDYTAREVGLQGECIAARYLVRRGMEVIAQNWRCRSGEVDIVAREGDGEVALVEVKTRLNLDGDPQSMPELAVDGAKQRRYRKIALVYLMGHPEVQRMRFDVIAININGDHNAKLRHLVGTFTWDS